ncbi:VOC family protein [Roseiconus nitratireducens]|nr:VOC family protein [Roseiconus nitratireducens]
MIEIDHLFLLVHEDSDAWTRIDQAGFVESYRRQHPGQGTENVCYCFDNLYLELLWLTDTQQATSRPIARTKLFERSSTPRACPFGIAYRGDDLSTPHWPYRPPYLAAGASLPVATDSDDLAQPLIFKSPHGIAPILRESGSEVPLQRAAGMTAATRITFRLPRSVPPSDSLLELEQRTILELEPGASYEFILEIQTAHGQPLNFQLSGA